MPKNNDIRAVLTGDLHWDHVPPTTRSAEPNWYEAMERAWRQVSDTASEHNVPIIVTGDVFNRWIQSAELVNFILGMLERCNNQVYAIPGNHDLKHHRLEDLRKTPFYTLVKSGRVKMIGGQPIPVGELVLHGFPYGVDVVPNAKPQTLALDVAVIHAMIWTKSTWHKGVPDELRLKNYKPKLKGYNVAVYGDNHSPFDATLRYKDDTECTVCNVGSLMRLNSKQIDYQPTIGLLHADGTVTRKEIDCSADKFIDNKGLKKLIASATEIDMSGFVKEMKAGGDNATNFVGEVVAWIRDNPTHPAVRELLSQAVGI